MAVDRRAFLKGALALPAVAVLPAMPAPAASTSFIGVDLAKPGSDLTVAWRAFYDPITDALFCEPIGAKDFYAAPDDAAMAS